MCSPEGSAWPYVWWMMFPLLMFSVLFGGHSYWKWLKRKWFTQFSWLSPSFCLLVFIMTSGKHIKIHFHFAIKVVLKIFQTFQQMNTMRVSVPWCEMYPMWKEPFVRFSVIPVNVGNQLKNITCLHTWKMCQYCSIRFTLLPLIEI